MIKETQRKPKRGGARQGAGRKPKTDGELRRHITLRLPQSLVDQLPATDRTDFIEQAIREKLEG